MSIIQKTVSRTVEIYIDITEDDLFRAGVVPMRVGHMSAADMGNRIDDALAELSLLGSGKFWLQKELEQIRDSLSRCRP